MTFGQYRPTLRPNRLSTLLLLQSHRRMCFHPHANKASAAGKQRKCGLACHMIVKTRDYVLGSGKREIVEAGPGRLTRLPMIDV